MKSGPRVACVSSILACALVLSLGGLGQTQTQDKVLGKTGQEWMDVLKNHKELKFRRAALIALEVLGAKSAGVLPAVTEALEKDADPQVRREAAMLLGRMGPDAKSSVRALGEALLADKSEAVREAAAQSLAGKLNKEAHEQVQALAQALADNHQGTRAAAAEAILKMGDKAAPALPNLMTLAKDIKKDRFSRQYALKCLSRLSPDNREVASILIVVLQDKDAPLPLREEAADGLGRLTVAADKVIPPLSETLSDPVVEVRRAVAAALVRQGKDAKLAWPMAKIAFKDQDQAVRYQLIRLAGQLGKDMEEPVATLLDHAQKDTNIENRLAAIQELGELSAQSSRTTNILSMLSLDDPSQAVRDAAETALKKLSGM